MTNRLKLVLVTAAFLVATVVGFGPDRVQATSSVKAAAVPAAAVQSAPSVEALAALPSGISLMPRSFSGCSFGAANARQTSSVCYYWTGSGVQYAMQYCETASTHFWQYGNSVYVPAVISITSQCFGTVTYRSMAHS